MIDQSETKKIAALSSLALLKEDMDSGKRDYTDYLRAFVEHAITKHGVDAINSETVADALRTEFGLNLPEKVIQLVLQRMARDGDLAKQGGLFLQAPGKLGKHQDFDLRRETLAQQVEALIKDFEDFIKPFEVKITREESLNAILDFLSKFAINYLRAYLLKTALPETPPASDKTQTLFAEFIRRSHEENNKTFERLITLVKGKMYANALLCPDLEGIKKNFKITNFFLDTPLALNILGHHGKQQEKSSIELVEQILKLGGKVSIFSHTLQEITSVLTNASNWVDRPDGRGNVIINARKQKLSRTDLLIKANNIEQDLAALKIGISNNPGYDNNYQISELNFQDALEERIEYYNDMAMRADVESVRSIYCLRGKTVPMRLEDTLAVVVSTNSAYARAAYEFGKSQNSSREVSPVITDFSLANIAWLKSPMEWKSMAEIETLSACYAALEPKAGDWHRYLQKIDELETSGKINPDEHALLRLTPINKIDTINLTDDVQDAALIGGSIREILERIQGDITATTRHELEITKRDRDDAKRISNEIKAEIEHEKGALNTLVDLISSIITTILLITPLSILIAFGLSAGSGLLAKFGLTVDNSSIVYWIVALIVTIGTMATLTGYSFKKTINSFKKLIASRIKKIIYSKS